MPSWLQRENKNKYPPKLTWMRSQRVDPNHLGYHLLFLLNVPLPWAWNKTCIINSSVRACVCMCICVHSACMQYWVNMHPQANIFSLFWNNWIMRLFITCQQFQLWHSKNFSYLTFSHYLIKFLHKWGKH